MLSRKIWNKEQEQGLQNLELNDGGKRELRGINTRSPSTATMHVAHQLNVEATPQLPTQQFKFECANPQQSTVKSHQINDCDSRKLKQPPSRCKTL